MIAPKEVFVEHIYQVKLHLASLYLAALHK